MEFRQLGNSGLKVPVLSFGTGTFGGKGEFFGAWGNTDAKEATRLIDICLDAGINFFDTANGYSSGESEIVLGKALAGRRDKVLISTKAVFPTSDDSLRRLGTDHIDIYHMHTFDAVTQIEETMY